MSTSTTQQFDGATIEDALSAAVATMGDDLEILDAQKVVKRRRFGVRKEERFEVVAAPRGQGDEEFESVLRRMVDRVDDEERRVVDLRVPTSGGVDLADSDMGWWEEADLVVPTTPRRWTRRRAADPGVAPKGEPVDEIDVRDRSQTIDQGIDREQFGPGPRGEAVPIAVDDASPIVDPSEPMGIQTEQVVAVDIPQVEPAPVAVAPVAVVPVAAAPEAAAPVALAQPAPTPAGIVAPLRTPGPAPAHAAPQPTGVPSAPEHEGIVWSIDELADLGLPPLVLERVASMAPASDLEWVAALAAALTDLSLTVGTEHATVELTGYGRRAAIDLIAGTCRGMRAGHLVIDGVRIAATPLELALGVRSCLQG